MNLIYICKVVDYADFNRVSKIKAFKTRNIKAFKTRNAAEKWGASTRDELANSDFEAGVTLINYDYEIQPIEFVNY